MSNITINTVNASLHVTYESDKGSITISTHNFYWLDPHNDLEEDVAALVTILCEAWLEHKHMWINTNDPLKSFILNGIAFDLLMIEAEGITHIEDELFMLSDKARFFLHDHYYLEVISVN